MTAPHGPKLFEAGLLVAHRTTPIRGMPAEVWEMPPALAEDERMIEMFLDHARLQHEYPRGWFAKIERFDESEIIAIAPPWVQLKTLIRAAPNGLDPGFVATFVRDVARELAATSTLFRGLSPTTLAIAVTGRPRLLDLTLAKYEARRARDTQVGVIKGELAFLSPELLRGQAADPRSDVFALGLIAIEMLTGKRVYRGEALDVVRAIQAGPAPTVPQLRDRALMQIVRQMVEREANDRSDARLIVAALEANVPQRMWTPEQMFAEVGRIAPAEARTAIEYGY